MPQSLMQVYLHITFSTKYRQKLIEPAIEPELFNYISAIAIEKRCPVLRINGVADHIHILCRLGKICTVPELLESIKKSSSKWIKTKGKQYKNFYWQDGYAAFSVNPYQLDTVKQYVDNQKEHHKKVSFQDELRAFLIKYKVDFDERYLWD